MTKAETKLPFQFCHVCSNRRRPTKNRSKTSSFELGKARPSSEGKFICVNGNWLWECDDCTQAHMLGQRESKNERELAEHIAAHRGYFGRVWANHEMWNYEYDFVFPEMKLIVELDSFSAHGQKHRYRDNLKENAARKNKWYFKRIRTVGNWMGIFVQTFEKVRSYRENGHRARGAGRPRKPRWRSSTVT